MFSHDVERALRAALDAHAGQTRKGSSIPYATHPVHVAMILARVGAAEPVLQAALLHDVVEDCDDWTPERVEFEFGPQVAAIVAQLTEDKGRTWEERKQAAVDHVPHMSGEAVLVKAADKLHNLSTLLAELRAARHPDDVWRHFTRGPAQTLELAGRLIEALAVRIPDALAGELRRTLGELRALHEG